jgi:hypothetical protein
MVFSKRGRQLGGEGVVDIRQVVPTEGGGTVFSKHGVSKPCLTANWPCPGRLCVRQRGLCYRPERGRLEIFSSCTEIHGPPAASTPYNLSHVTAHKIFETVSCRLNSRGSVHTDSTEYS